MADRKTIVGALVALALITACGARVDSVEQDQGVENSKGSDAVPPDGQLYAGEINGGTSGSTPIVANNGSVGADGNANGNSNGGADIQQRDDCPPNFRQMSTEEIAAAMAELPARELLFSVSPQDITRWTISGKCPANPNIDQSIQAKDCVDSTGPGPVICPKATATVQMFQKKGQPGSNFCCVQFKCSGNCQLKGG
jgi:hypothetical protein